MIETTVESIRVSLVTQNRVVILKEVDGARHLPIWIGAYEAEAIALELQGVTPTRPLPYDLMRTLIDELGANIDQIAIARLDDQVFYAQIVVSIADRTVEIDARPSDAIALAVRTDARIFVDDSVMENAGVSLENDDLDPSALQPTDLDAASITDAGGSTTEDDDNGARSDELGVFRDFINSLDLDDFDKRQSN